MRKIYLLILISLFVSGCAVKKEGIGFRSNNDYKFMAIEPDECYSEGCPEAVIVIGNLSAYRDLSENIAEEYSKYSEATHKFLVDKPVSLTEQEFADSVIGWTKLQFFKIPLVGAIYYRALVDNSKHLEMQFPSDAEVILLNKTGDLVAAKSNSDGIFFLERLLCSRGDVYKECKENYSRGTFDAKSGQELDLKLRKKKNGKVINIENYEVLKDH